MCGIAGHGGVVYIVIFFLPFPYCFCWAERTYFTYYTPHELYLLVLIIPLMHLSSPHLARIVLFIWRHGTGLVFLRGLALLQAATLSYFFALFFLKKLDPKKWVVSHLDAGRHASDRKAKSWPVLIGRGAGGGEEGELLKMIDFNHIFRFA